MRQHLCRVPCGISTVTHFGSENITTKYLYPGFAQAVCVELKRQKRSVTYSTTENNMTLHSACVCMIPTAPDTFTEL